MDLTGRSLKQYRLVEKLGQGGMGVVYRARDTVLGRDAAVKVLLPDRLHDEVLRQRFHREARAASALNHPSIITIYEIGSEDGIDFMAMEYVDGRTLYSILHSERLSVAAAAAYAVQIAEALAKAHAAGIVHRDLKPGNLMITTDGIVKVLDFGLARLNPAASQFTQGAAGASTMYVTRVGTVMGTVAYMSPEQARGEEVSAQSDVFSLGIVLFEMLSGELPFSGNSEIAFLHNLHFGKARDVRSLRPDVPEELARIVSHMLQQDLNARCSSMVEVRQELRRFVGSASTIAPPSEEQTVWMPAPTPPRSYARRTRWAVAAAASVLLVAGAAVLGERFGVLAPGKAYTSKLEPSPAETAIPESATPYELYLQARQALDRFDRPDNAKRAIHLLEHAVQKDRDFALGFAALAEAYRYRNQLSPDKQWVNLIEQNAKRAYELTPELASAHVAMGLAFMESSQRYKESEAHLKKAIDLDPRSSAAHKWLGVLLMSRKEFDAAEEALRRALELDDKNWAALLDLGVLYYRTPDFSKAAESWEQAHKLCPDNARILANLSAAYHKLGRYEEAASVLQQAIGIQPSAQHYANLGTLRFSQGRYADAIPPFEQARDREPNRYQYWANLADAYRWSPGDKPKAKPAYDAAIHIVREQLELKRADPDLRSSLALYLAKSGDKETSLRELSQLEAAKPASADVLFRMAVAYEVCQVRDRALELLEKSLAAGYPPQELRIEPELVQLRADSRYRIMMAVRSQKKPA